jgi:hypothetical protein
MSIIWAHAVDDAIENADYFYCSHIFCVTSKSPRLDWERLGRYISPGHTILYTGPMGPLTHPLLHFFLISRDTEAEVQRVTDRRGMLKMEVRWCDYCRAYGSYKSIKKSWVCGKSYPNSQFSCDCVAIKDEKRSAEWYIG